jgi:hypothetical protein
MSTIHVRSAALTFLVVALATPVFAQQSAPATDADSAKLTLRTYDVRDLVMVVPDHKLESQKADPNSTPQGGGRFGGGGGGFGAVGGGGLYDGANPAPTGPQPIEIGRLVDVIMQTVAPDSWYGGQRPAVGPGGPEGQPAGPVDEQAQGRIQQLGSSLVVLQRPDVHELIDNLLHRLRDASGVRRTVSIDARWLLLNSDDLDRLVKPADNGLLVADRKVLAELTRLPGNLRAITNSFSGQQVYLTSGTRRNVVSGYIPVVGSIDFPTGRDALAPNSAPVQLAQLGGASGMETAPAQPVADKGVGYQPIVQTTNFGVQLEIRPTLQMDKTAVVDLKSTVTFPDEQTATAPIDPAAIPGMLSPAPSVDRLSMNALELATTMIAPLGQPVLVGGMTQLAAGQPSMAAGAAPPPAGPEGIASSEENRQLYLILELR